MKKLTRQEILATYKKRRQYIVKLRDNGMTFDAIAEKIGVTRPRIIQIYQAETSGKD